jgi:hypothetical protein
VRDVVDARIVIPPDVFTDTMRNLDHAACGAAAIPARARLAYLRLLIDVSASSP